MELDSRVADGRRAEIFDACADSVTPLYSLLRASSGPHRGDGELTHAIIHLVSRSITDLVAATHLASHGYLQQVNTLVRPVYESCDLIELFVKDPTAAGRWQCATLDYEFKPSKVRKEIGEPPESGDVYKHLSRVGTHPRFEGSRLSSGMWVNDHDPTDRQLVTRIGPFFRWHPASVIVVTWVFDAIVRLGLKMRHLEVVCVNSTRDQWVPACLECVRAVSRGCKLVRQELVEMKAGDDTELMDTMYDALIVALEPGGVLADPDTDADEEPEQAAT